MSLMPSSTSAGTGAFAQILALWPFVLALLALIAMRGKGGSIGDAFTHPPVILGIIDVLAFFMLSAYGLATVFGKSLEA